MEQLSKSRKVGSTITLEEETAEGGQKKRRAADGLDDGEEMKKIKKETLYEFADGQKLLSKNAETEDGSEE